MVEISGLGPMQIAKPVAVRTELKVSLDKLPMKEPIADLAKVEVEMQNAEKAFAMMMDIRAKIETAYNAINSTQES